MTAQEILALRSSDRLNYAGKTCHVVDWLCHREPVFAADGTRIDAEPIFQFSNGLRHTVHPSFWHEITKP